MQKHSPTQIGLNSTQIKLFSGPRPLASPAEEHVWTALFSRGAFYGKTAPFDDIGLRIEEPCVFTKMQIDRNDVSPRFAEWHNKRADHYKNLYLIEGKFSWLSETNLSAGMTIPLKSDLIINVTPPHGQRSPAAFSELTIDTISTVPSAAQFAPNIKGRSVVLDYRFGGPLGRTYVEYDRVINGVIPGTNSSMVQKAKFHNWFFAIQRMHKYEKAGPKNRAILIAGFVVITLAFSAIAFLTSKHQTKGEK